MFSVSFFFKQFCTFLFLTQFKMKGILKIVLVLFVLSIAKARPVPGWEDEEEWDEDWTENVDALDEEEDEDAWDEEEDEEAWDEGEDEEAWDEKEDEEPWDEEEDDEAWDEEDSGAEDEAWGDGDNAVLQDDLTGEDSDRGEDNGDKEQPGHLLLSVFNQ